MVAATLHVYFHGYNSDGHTLWHCTH